MQIRRIGISDTVLKYDAEEIGLDGVDAADYYVVLEGMYDGTIRKNPLGKETLKVTAQGYERPQKQRSNILLIKRRHRLPSTTPKPWTRIQSRPSAIIA
ncbi:MAG: hypothetical protein ACOX4M_02140 [Acetivibrionales bacterium]